MLALCAPVYWTGLLTILLFGSGIGRVVQLGFVDTGIYQSLTDDPVAWLRLAARPLDRGGRAAGRDSACG